jgi:excisionase family DNA binding protein
MNEDLSMTEAALLYGCGRSNMFYLINSGRIPHHRDGREIKVKREDVLALRDARDGRMRHNQWIDSVARSA